MGWKRYCNIIMLAKFLESSLRPEVTDSTVYYGAIWPSRYSKKACRNAQIMFSAPNVVYPVNKRVNILLVFELCSCLF
jgi:hypothetical protein